MEFIDPMEDNFIDAEDRKQAQETQDSFERRRQRELNDFSKVLDTVEGRRVLWRLLGVAGVYHISHDVNSGFQTAYNEGRRSIGLIILDDVNLSKPKAFAQMQREFISEQNSRKEKRNE
jgi:hypothetical protein